jgi:hypothetical protein
MALLNIDMNLSRADDAPGAESKSLRFWIFEFHTSIQQRPTYDVILLN